MRPFKKIVEQFIKKNPELWDDSQEDPATVAIKNAMDTAKADELILKSEMNCLEKGEHVIELLDEAAYILSRIEYRSEQYQKEYGKMVQNNQELGL